MVQRCRSAEVQGWFIGAEVQRYRYRGSIEVQMYRGTEVQQCRGAADVVHLW